MKQTETLTPGAEGSTAASAAASEQQTLLASVVLDQGEGEPASYRPPTPTNRNAFTSNISACCCCWRASPSG